MSTRTATLPPRWRLAPALATVAVLGLVAAGCTAAPEATPSASAPSSAASTTAAGPPSAAVTPTLAPLTVDITLANGQVIPNGEKLTAKVGQPIVLNVTSDEDDEIHAHTGGDGYELEVKAGTPVTGTFTPEQAGSFEVESHHLEKIIVILNVS